MIILKGWDLSYENVILIDIKWNDKVRLTKA